MMGHQLEVKNLYKKYARREVVNDVSFSVKGGEIVGLLGPNGAGKTTCFYITCGLVRSSKGEVTLDNKSICLLYTSPSPRDRTRSRMPSSA